MTPPPGFRYIDVHTHLHPEWLFRAIRRWFAERSNWNLESPTDPAVVAGFLRERGVERFLYCSYAHKAGIAREINAWLHATRARAPGGLPLGTIHPDDPDMLEGAEEALTGYDFPGFKFHINVQRFFPDDPRVMPVYERLLALDRLLLSLAGRSTRLRGEKEEWERPPIANLLWLSSQEGLWAKLGLLREAAFPRHEVMAQIYPGYRPALRGWFLLRRAADLLRLALRLAGRLGRGRSGGHHG